MSVFAVLSTDDYMMHKQMKINKYALTHTDAPEKKGRIELQPFG